MQKKKKNTSHASDSVWFTINLKFPTKHRFLKYRYIFYQRRMGSSSFIPERTLAIPLCKMSSSLANKMFPNRPIPVNPFLSSGERSSEAGRVFSPNIQLLLIKTKKPLVLLFPEFDMVSKVHMHTSDFRSSMRTKMSVHVDSLSLCSAIQL